MIRKPASANTSITARSSASSPFLAAARIFGQRLDTLEVELQRAEVGRLSQPAKTISSQPSFFISWISLPS
jgi:hypothetical protein